SQAPCQRISRTHLPDSRAKAAAAPPAPVPSTVPVPGRGPRSLRASAPAPQPALQPAPQPAQELVPESPEKPNNQTKQQLWADQERTCERSLVLPRAEGTRERPAASCAWLRVR